MLPCDNTVWVEQIPSNLPIPSTTGEKTHRKNQLTDSPSPKNSSHLFFVQQNENSSLFHSKSATIRKRRIQNHSILHVVLLVFFLVLAITSRLANFSPQTTTNTTRTYRQSHLFILAQVETEATNDKCYGYLPTDVGVCSGHGTCISKNTCECDVGYYSIKCSNAYSCYGLTMADSGVCSDRGNCTNNDTCTCKAGYTGSQCEAFSCFSLSSNVFGVCSGHGTCTGWDTCSCNNNYSGSLCNITTCHGLSSEATNVCGGTSRGSCLDYNTCKCNSGYDGSSCELNVCFGFLSNMTGLVCGGHGQCVGPDTCSCDSGYYGSVCNLPSCFGKLANSSSSCSGNGTCVSVDSCSCFTGYTGQQCQIPICFGILANDSTVCTNQAGDCIAPDMCQCKSSNVSGSRCETAKCNGSNEGSCSCPYGWTGSYCNITSCFGLYSNDSNVCNHSNGTCIGPNSCSCGANYTGERCQFPLCYGVSQNDSSVCNGVGYCSGPNTCVCNAGWSDPACQETTCFGVSSKNSTVCSGRGTCSGPNSCSCYAKFAGNNCQLYECFGVLSNVSTVCGGQGSCQGRDNCSCNDNSKWTGKDCSSPICFGLSKNDSAVCGGNGTCIAPNVCYCSGQYGGYDCTMPSCFGTFANESSVCSGKGVCTGINTCICTAADATGSKCDLPKCFGVPSTDLVNVCSGNGECFSANVCTCYTGFIGPQCEYAQCYGIPSNNSSVCSGNGNCIFANLCKCNKGYVGAKCDVLLLNSVDITIIPSSTTIFEDNTNSTLITMQISNSNFSKTYATRSLTYSYFINSTTTDTMSFNLTAPLVTLPFLSKGQYGLTLTIYDNQSKILIVRKTYANILIVITLTDISSSPETVSKLNPSDIKTLTTNLNSVENRTAIISAIATALSSKNSYTLDEGTDMTTSLITITSSFSQYVTSSVSNDITSTISRYSASLLQTVVADPNKVNQIASNIISVASNVIKKAENQNASLLVERAVENSVSLISIANSNNTISETRVVTDNFYVVVAFTNANRTIFDTNYTVSIPETNQSRASYGMIKYANNLWNSIQDGETLLFPSSDIIHLRTLIEGTYVPLKGLTQPLNLTFAIDNSKLNQSEVDLFILQTDTSSYEVVISYKCRYWNETEGKWLANGCLTTIFPSNVLCSCDHTTRFSSFIDLSRVPLKTRVVQEGIAVANITSSSVFLVVISVILILLVLLRNDQPVKSRYITPYLALVSLLIENLMLGIVSKSVSIGEPGYINVLLLSQITAIISTTFRAIAVWCYFLMSVRYLVHRYFYEWMLSTLETEKKDQLIEFLNVLKKEKVLIISSISVGSFFALYFSILVILSATSVMTSYQFSVAATVSLFILLVSMAVLVVIVYIADFILEKRNNQAYDDLADIAKDVNTEHAVDATHPNAKHNLVKKGQTTAKRLFSLIFFGDRLMFRLEALIFFAGIVAFIISYCIGFSTLNTRYNLNNSIQTTNIIDMLDAIGYVFELIMTICFIISFGGLAVVLTFISRFKKSRTISQTETDDYPVYKLLQNNYMMRLFRQFAKNEFSLENLACWLRVENARSTFGKLWFCSDSETESTLSEKERRLWAEFATEVKYWRDTHVSSSGLMAVNMSGSTRRKCLAICSTLELIDLTQLSNKECTELKRAVAEMVEGLTSELIYNLMDTYARFVLTEEYKILADIEQTRELITQKVFQ